MLRHEFGGDKHFVSFAFENENETFRLKPCDSAPLFDDFIQRQRYRIETELDNGDDDDDDDDDYMQVYKSIYSIRFQFSLLLFKFMNN